MADPAIKQGLSVLGTLAFCIPGPWGVVASAALQAIGFMLPGDGHDPVVDAVKKSTNDIESFFATYQLSVDTAYLAGIKKWLKRVDNTDHLYTNSATLEGIIAALATLDAPITLADQAFNDLPALYSNLYARPKDTTYEIAQAAISGEISMRLAIAQCLNLRVSLTQSLASLYADSDVPADRAKLLQTQRELESHYDNLVAYIRTYLSSDAAIAGYQKTFDALKAYRVSLVDASVEHWPPFGNINVTFTDQLTGQDTTTDAHYAAAFVNADWADSKNHFRRKAKQQRDNYIGALEAQADSFANGILDLCKTAKSIWALAPRMPAPPSNAPAIDFYDTGNAGAWQAPGKFVCYRFYYLAPGGRTVESPTGPVNAAGQAHYLQCPSANSQVPHITFPDEPTGIANSRILIRTIADDANGSNARDELVAIPSMANEFYDLWPVLPTDVAPNAMVAPVIAGWACNRATEAARGVKCSWDDPAPVRYRYRYTRGTIESIQWSPWSVAQKADAGCTTDGQGFVTHDGLYVAMMQVPEVAGCGFVLQRQFAGKAILPVGKISVTKGQLGSQPVIWLEDATGP